jgi:NADH-quinone oxidoreductase subunit F
MDRMVIESFPFRVIEGIAIAAATLDAGEGFIYVRTEYPLAIARLRRAIRLCEVQGILGFSANAEAEGSETKLRLSIVEGGGAFVCGEETALLASIEGRRSVPRVRPPYPAESGLEGKPTLINNVETFATIPWIVRNGADAFRKYGSPSSPGTKTFALAGRIKRGGLIEVPMGISLREIIYEIGGGIQEDRAFKAVQIGGPSGGCIPAYYLDIPVDYEALTAKGAMMGSGGLIVLDETDCMVEVARYFMSFVRRESCGKCTACRIGTMRMFEILEKLTEGKGTENDIAELERLSEAVSNLSLCGLGRSGPNPVTTTLRYFRAEYIAHIEGRCPALRCKALITYSINEKCIGCTRCSQSCPADAIGFAPYERHAIDNVKCTRCDTCRQVCPVEAVDVG